MIGYILISITWNWSLVFRSRLDMPSEKLFYYITNVSKSHKLRVLVSSVYRMPSFKQKCCAFPCKAFFSGNFGVIKNPGDRDLRCRICQASCTLVITKRCFVLPRVTCRLLRIGAILSLFRLAKRCPGNLNNQVTNVR